MLFCLSRVLVSTYLFVVFIFMYLFYISEKKLRPPSWCSSPLIIWPLLTVKVTFSKIKRDFLQLHPSLSLPILGATLAQWSLHGSDFVPQKHFYRGGGLLTSSGWRLRMLQRYPRTQRTQPTPPVEPRLRNPALAQYTAVWIPALKSFLMLCSMVRSSFMQPVCCDMASCLVAGRLCNWNCSV